MVNLGCFRRLGSVSTMQGEYLSEIGTKLLHENDPVLETLPLVLSGKAAVDSELDAYSCLPALMLSDS